MVEGEEIKPTWTPLKIIQWAVPFLKKKGVQNPRFDVESLLAFALKTDRLKVYLQFDRPLDSHELGMIRELLQRRARFEPMQYLTGQREFYGLPFRVSKGVLIPRPETELLVELAIEHLKNMPEEKRLVLDLGTGSGCIAISVAKNIACRVWAVDISKIALEIAKENARDLSIESIQWREGDWFSAMEANDPREFQVILSNPPYIPLGDRADLSPEVKDFEPFEALFGGEDGLTAYQRIAVDLDQRLSRDGTAFFELQANKSDNIISVFRGFPWKQRVYPDLQGLPRVLMLNK